MSLILLRPLNLRVRCLVRLELRCGIEIVAILVVMGSWLAGRLIVVVMRLLVRVVEALCLWASIRLIILLRGTVERLEGARAVLVGVVYRLVIIVIVVVAVTE